MRIVFMGSPEFALPSLERLIASEHEVAAVFTQPDRPAGRGRKLVPPPVKTLALEHGIPVYQPRSVSKADSVALLRDIAPDAGIIAAYGQLLRQPVLDVPRLGFLNVHASLLPRWRGASPIAAAILAGDRQSGATIMQVVLELDAGPMLDRAAVDIAREDTSATLSARIADAGADLLVRLLPRWERGEITPVPQDDTLATYAPQIKKADALIDFDAQSAEAIERKVRAYNPWPMAYALIDGSPLRIVEAIAIEHRSQAEPGTIVAFTGVGETPLLGAGFVIATRGNDLGVVTVQGAGGRVMSAAQYLNGHRDIVGKRLTAG